MICGHLGHLKLVAVVTCLGVCVAAGGDTVQPWPWDVHRITNNSAADTNPQIYGRTIVWQGNDGSYEQIYFWDGSQQTDVTDTSYNNQAPQLHAGKVAWQADNDIYYWDSGSGTTTKITDDGFSDTVPQIHNGEVTWARASEIYFWDGTSSQRISDDQDHR